MSNIIKISREFSNSQLGNLWLGREITIDDSADPISAFIKANEELVNAYGRLSGENGVGRYLGDEYGQTGKMPENYFSKGNNGLDIIVTDIPPKEQRVNAIIETITSSKTIKEVEFWRNTVTKENIPSLTEAFETKIKELS